MPFSATSPADTSRAASRSRAVRALRGLAWTAASLGLVTVIKLLAFDYIGPATPFLLYFASIIAGAWFGGWTGGVAVTALSALVGFYLFMPPYHALRPPDLVEAVRLGFFFLEGLALTAITTWLRAEQRRCDTAVADAQGSLAKLEGVLHGVEDGITVQTARGGLVYANEAAARLTGFSSAEEMVRASPADIVARFDLLDPDGAPLDVLQLPGRRVLQGLPAPERLVRFRIRATGEERIARIRANAVSVEALGDRFAVNVFQDVTEAREQAEALRVSNEWLATTLRSIGDAVIATDARGRVSFMNPLAEQLTGWSSSEAEGVDLARVFHIVEQETRGPVESPPARVLREGNVVGPANHTILIARDGSEAAIDDSAAPIRSESGELIGSVLVFRDVSARRAEERRRAFIARASAELATSLDIRRTLSALARLAVPAVGDWCAIDLIEDGELRHLAVEHVDPGKVQLVRDIETRYPEDPGKAGGRHEVVRTGLPVFAPHVSDEALVAAARDEQHLELMRRLQLRSYLAVPLIIQGTVIGVLTLATADSGREYTQPDLDLASALADRLALAVNHSRLYAQATAARLEAERANRAKDEFLAMLGHELRNPLAPILTALQIIELRAPTAIERERAILARQVKHVVSLVDDLLDVSRITQGKIELSRESIVLRDLVTKTIEQVGPLLEKRRHQVHIEIPPELAVAGDPMRLAQVVSNLLSNAAKYTEPGGRIEISGSRDGGDVVLRVVDSGVGLHPDLLPRVFDLFVQGGQSIDRAQGGLGLGLTIVRSVVELHGGRVSAHSDGPGSGSEFRVMLPAPEAGTVAAAPEQAVVRLPVTAGVKVLIVDDNEDALALLGEALALSGYETHTATDAATAIARARDLLPHIALLDIGLPVMDGYDLARSLRQTSGLEKLRLVAITGYGQAADRERARSAGFDEHLVKPISVDDVQRVVERLLDAASG
jgi:PAS domain S-box-containing protein